MRDYEAMNPSPPAPNEYQLPSTARSGRLETSIVIQRPVQDVFDFMDRPENEPIWQPSTRLSEYTSEGPVGVGTTGRSVISSLFGGEREVTWTITHYEPNHLASWETNMDGFHTRQSWLYEAVEEGTRVTRTTELVGDFAGFRRLIGKLSMPLAARMQQNAFRRQLQSLKRLMEA